VTSAPVGHDISLADLAEAVAREAGQLVLSRRRSEVTVAATKSTDLDIVTDSDRASEQLIRSRLLDARPDDAVLGEEHGTTSGTSGVTWVVDPIDGTVNYLYGIPAYAVSVAAVDPEGALVGVVFNPATGELWRAVRGGGAFLDGQPISVSARSELAESLVGTGFAYDIGVRGGQGAVVAALLPRVRDVRRAGSAALDLCAVACGRLDGYYEQGLAPWDLAAGRLIAEEAGARVGGLGDSQPSARLVVAATPALYPKLQAVLAELGA
jgi:myo-inositol-1(or 4)-monophosphatase